MMLKRILSIVIALFLLCNCTIPLFSAYRTTTFDFSTDQLHLIVNHNGAYLLSYSGGDCNIEKLSPDAGGAGFHLHHTIADAGIFGDTVVALCNDIENDQLEVYTYHVQTDALDSFAVNSVRDYGSKGFAWSGDSLYLISDRHSYIVDQYNSSGRLVNSFSFGSSVTQLGTDFRGNVIAVCAGALYRFTGSSFVRCSPGLAAPVTFFDDDFFTDANGTVFRLDGSSYRSLFDTESNYGAYRACMIEDIVYYPDGSQIYGYDIASGQKVSVFSLNTTILGLYAHNGYICALSNGAPTVDRIRTDEFSLLNQNEDSDDRPHDDSPTRSVDTDRSYDDTITSDIYRIDFDTYFICGIPAGTTLAQLKQNIRCNGFEVRFYRNGSQKKSGKCGTAMTAVFDSDRATYTFELSVIGDITGEGNANSRDTALLMEYLLGKADFNGVFITSADLSGDDIIDVKDLAMLRRMY